MLLFISESLLWAGTRAVGGEEGKEKERDERRRGGEEWERNTHNS